MISELNDDEILDFLMTSEFEDDYSPSELKYLLVKWRYFYRLLYGNSERKSVKFEGDIKDLTEQLEDIKKQISAASFEAAAISAAMDFETRAVKIYSERAEAATDVNEKELYKMLADWETGHNLLLHKLNTDLKEEIWYDNNFWPF